MKQDPINMAWLKAEIRMFTHISSIVDGILPNYPILVVLSMFFGLQYYPLAPNIWKTLSLSPADSSSSPFATPYLIKLSTVSFLSSMCRLAHHFSELHKLSVGYELSVFNFLIHHKYSILLIGSDSEPSYWPTGLQVSSLCRVGFRNCPPPIWSKSVLAQTGTWNHVDLPVVSYRNIVQNAGHKWI